MRSFSAEGLRLTATPSGRFWTVVNKTGLDLLPGTETINRDARVAPGMEDRYSDKTWLSDVAAGPTMCKLCWSSAEANASGASSTGAGLFDGDADGPRIESSPPDTGPGVRDGTGAGAGAGTRLAGAVPPEDLWRRRRGDPRLYQRFRMGHRGTRNQCNGLGTSSRLPTRPRTGIVTCGGGRGDRPAADETDMVDHWAVAACRWFVQLTASRSK